MSRIRNLTDIYSMGLTNEYSPDFLESSGKSKRFEKKAYCDSVLCCHSKWRKEHPGVKINKQIQIPLVKMERKVPFTAETCPDCGSYLFWQSTEIK